MFERDEPLSRAEGRVLSYLTGISQNIVAEVLMAIFLTFLWGRVRRWWSNRPPARADAGTGEAEPRVGVGDCLTSTARWFSRGLAFACLVAALHLSSVEAVLFSGAFMGIFFAGVVGLGSCFIAGLLQTLLSTEMSCRIGYWISFLACSSAWLLEPHAILVGGVPDHRALAFGFQGMAFALVSAGPMIRRFAGRWPQFKPVERRVLGIAILLVLLVVLLERYRATWTEVLFWGPAVAVLPLTIVLAMFHWVVDLSRSISRWASANSMPPPARSATSSARPWRQVAARRWDVAGHRSVPPR